MYLYSRKNFYKIVKSINLEFFREIRHLGVIMIFDYLLNFHGIFVKWQLTSYNIIENWIIARKAIFQKSLRIWDRHSFRLIHSWDLNSVYRRNRKRKVELSPFDFRDGTNIQSTKFEKLIWISKTSWFFDHRKLESF